MFLRDEAGYRDATELLPLVYSGLRRLAARSLEAESPDHTLQPTALVHEAYLRLATRRKEKGWESRAEYLNAAAEEMRRILVDHARGERRLRRGGAWERIPLTDELVEDCRDGELIAVDECLDALAAQDSDLARMVRMHVFVGLTVEEAGAEIGWSPRTSYRKWSFAPTWLFRRQTKGESDQVGKP